MARFDASLVAAALSIMTSVTVADAIECGDSDSDGKVAASDSLAVLQTAVDLRLCEPCQCDYSGDGRIGVDDALLVVKRAVSTGNPPAAGCPACTEAVCGDGVLAAYRARPFTNLYVGDCEEFDGDYPSVDVASARDTKFRDVTEHVAVDVYKSECLCLEDRAGPAADAARKARVHGSSGAGAVEADADESASFTSSTYCTSDCLWGVEVHSDVPLTEAMLTADSLCYLGVKPPLHHSEDFNDFTIDSQVREECDDGNTEDGDGCSSDCRIETP